MTPNEKAATFIGWIAGRKCDGNLGRSIWGPIICDDGSHYTPKKNPEYPLMPHFDAAFTPNTHDHPAPDMSKPENYMRALEAVRARGYEWNMGGLPEWIREALNSNGHADRRIHTVAIWSMGHVDLVKESYGDSDNGEAGDAVIKVLAALYDKEHIAEAAA